MPWVVGIDEAGYGPNLGPFVMTSVACRLPADLAGADLWKVLRAAVRRYPSPPDGRLLIEDSKLVYSSRRGLLDLETGVLAALAPWRAGEGWTVARYLDWVAPSAHAALSGEPWYTGTSTLPVLAQSSAVAHAAERFRKACASCGLCWGRVRSVVLCPAGFNALLDRWGSKGAALAHALLELIACNRDPDAEAGPVSFFIDKHGGRNRYADLLRGAFPGGEVVTHEEGMDCSAYRVDALGREVRMCFQPRADAEHFGVALASMASKYLRELLMREFNAFWQGQVPGLKPTAGYPGDAARFFDQIRPAAQRLGIPEDVLWRRK